MNKHKDLTGSTINYFYVIGRCLPPDSSKQNKSVWYLCRCVCGTEKAVRGDRLTAIDGTKSCGCKRIEALRKSRTIHGMKYTKEYMRWQGHKRRELKKLLDSGWSLEMDKMLRRIQPVCVVCGSSENLTVDHVLPLSKGHGLKPGNAVTLCISCNAKKGVKPLTELDRLTRREIKGQAKWFALQWKWKDTDLEAIAKAAEL